MQFQVPQNIDMEDRIIGPLTMIQFGIVVVGGFASFFVFTMTGVPVILSRGLGGFLAFITVLMALGKFNDQPLFRFSKYILAFLVRPRARVWHKTGIEIHPIAPTKQVKEAEKVRNAKLVSKSQIAQLASVVDSRGKRGVITPVQPKK